MQQLKNELDNLYNDLNILHQSPMHNCSHRHTCWAEVEEERRENCDWGIYTPFIGSNYDAGRVLALGINMNGFGDADAEDKLAKLAIDEIMLGRVRTFAKSGYRGSLFWHRLLSYSALLLRAVRIIPTPTDRPYPPKEELKSALDYIAVTNSIKCAPSGKNSQPLPAMWLHCPQHILLREVEILRPRFIVVLGVYNYLWVKDLFQASNEVRQGEISLSFGRRADASVSIIGIPHPSSSQGTSLRRMDELEQLLDNLDLQIIG